MIGRRHTLLALLDALGGEVAALDFQKFLFLYTREFEKEPSFEFVPYRYGCFSFTSYADKRALIEKGLLASEEKTWHLTMAGRRALRIRYDEGEVIARFIREYRGLRGEELIRLTYRRYPSLAWRSEIVERLLETDRSALDAISASRPPGQPAGLCTIGYEGRSLEGYLNRLLESGVTLLCDVRRNAISRKYGFTKVTLKHACEGVGIRYEHAPALGIASEQRRQLDSPADYVRLFSRYVRYSLPKQSGLLNQVSTWIREGHRVALTCYELDPQRCHRQCVAAALERSSKGSLKTIHL
jgi:Protein of unknown function, DUF488